MSIVITASGNLGPFKNIDVLEDCLMCDSVCYPFSVIGTYSVSEDDSLAQPILVDVSNIGVEARSERNRLLSESDWTQVADAPVDKAAWATYRQALRDLPQQAGFPVTITWPVKP